MAWLLAQLLPLDLDAMVVTSSPDVAPALRDHPTVEVDLLGGRLHRMSQTVTGAGTVAQLQALRHDACVVSACGDAPRAAVAAYERLGVAVMTPEPRTAVPAAA